MPAADVDLGHVPPICTDRWATEGLGSDGPSLARAAGSRACAGSTASPRQPCPHAGAALATTLSPTLTPGGPGGPGGFQTQKCAWASQFITLVYIPPLFSQLNAGEPAVDTSKSTRLRKLVLFLAHFFL